MRRRAFLRIAATAAVATVRGLAQRRDASDAVTLDAAARAYHVQPGGSIQAALEAAAKDPANKTVYVHAGTYRPAAHGQALIWFNQRHDGITLEAVGEVVLTAANPAIADNKSPSFPAVVTHVVYFGDGISTKTVLRGFRVTGANNYTNGTGQRSPINWMTCPRRRSLSRWRRHQDLCARLSNHRARRSGRQLHQPMRRRCIRRAPRPAARRRRVPRLHLPRQPHADHRRGVDLLRGSRATLDNCLFVGNVANLGVDYIGMMTGGEYHPENGSVATTVFEGSRADVSRCTFTGNWAGVDDNGTGSTYVKSIFWNNTLKGGISAGARYEIDITRGEGVRESFIHGETNDLRGTIDRAVNTFDPPDPRFDAQFVPQAPEYGAVGYLRGRGIARAHKPVGES